MGTFHIGCKVENVSNRKNSATIPKMLVDTGSEYTWVPTLILEKLGIAHATFVGHSMGGGVVQRFAVTHPEAVDALVLVASVSGEGRSGRRILLPPGPLLKLVVPVLEKFAASRMLRGSFYDPAKLTNEVRDEYMRPIRVKGSMDGLIAIMRDGADDQSVDVAKITQPVLLLYGSHDKLVPASVGREIQQRVPHARMVVVDRAGHLLLEEQPEECASAILDFLREMAGCRQESTALPSCRAGNGEPLTATARVVPKVGVEPT